MSINNTTPPVVPQVELRLRDYDFFNKDAYVISTGIFTAVAILANLFLMIVILASSKLRSSSQHVIIFALCLSNLFIGAFDYSLITEFYYWEKWIHNCRIVDILEYDLFYITPSINSLLVISIGADFVLRVLLHSSKVRIVTAFIMIGVSVGSSVAVLLPIRLAGLGQYCAAVFSETFSRTLSITCIMPQTLGIVLIIGLVSSMHCCNSKQFESPNLPKSGPWDIILAGIIVVLGYLPYHFWMTIQQGCSGSYCTEFFITRGVLSRIFLLPPCLLPFVWFLNSLTRKGIKDVFCCRRDAHKDHDVPREEMTIVKNIYSTKM